MGTVKPNLAPLAVATTHQFEMAEAAIPAKQPINGVFDVRDYGAVGDGKTIDTRAIQGAIDAVNRACGGRVYLQGGNFLTGTIFLRSNVTLYLEAGVTLFGSTNLKDYPSTIPAYRSNSDNYTNKSIIYAEKANNIAIMGRGIIDGQEGSAVFKGKGMKPARQRPLIIRMIECSNVSIINCQLSSGCHAIKLGTDSTGGFRNITISNCNIYDTRKCGLDLFIVDGGTLDGVNVSNITMNNMGAAVFVRLGRRVRKFPYHGNPYPFRWGEKTGILRNVTLSNIVATNVSVVGCGIAGLVGHPVENITLNNVRIRYRGGNKGDKVMRKIPEKAGSYPVYTMFGTLPAYGFWVRHAKNVEFHNMDLGFAKPDNRPALFFDDVDGLDIFNLDAQTTPAAQALIWLKQVKAAFIHGNRPKDKVATFVRLEGSDSGEITLMNNDLANVEQVLKKGEGVKCGAVNLGGKK